MTFKAITANVEGGTALARHLRDIESRLGHGAHVNVGFFATEIYPATESGDSIPVAQAAFWNEFGTVNSPERPFMRTMVQKRSPRWGVTLGKYLRQTDYDAELALAMMGEEIQGQLRRSIQDWSAPPNAESTIAKKGFNKPLTDTGEMWRAVGFQVLHGEGLGND